jgi:Mor family transcriptional regulator
VQYKNGEVILPPDLLERLQDYVQGEILYIPKKEKKRIGWGEESGTKGIIRNRNEEIFRAYSLGVKISELAFKYFLSEDSIRKIVRSMKVLTLQSETLYRKEVL